MKGDLTKFQVHGTHVPMLRAIGQSMRIGRVIEFGCGLFSTKTFLDTTYFPNLASLFSYETDQKWLGKLSFLKDRRWKPIKISKTAVHLQKITYPKNIDLVFVDGPWAHRKHILQKMNYLARIYVIHDFGINRWQSQRSKPKYVHLWPASHMHTCENSVCLRS